MNYGVIPVHADRPRDLDRMLARVDSLLTARGLAKPNDLVVVMAGTHLYRPGDTGALLMHLVGTS